ncbi:MAG: GNAT family N-acetyltransferase [Bacteroidetes bacterium]|nr:GNAT family N-acetyltransferase [Bacteroidota bacterium]
MISIQRISIKDSLYESERQLRNRVLLRPIGLPDHAWEMHDEKSWHFIAVEEGNVIGCVALFPLDSEGHKAQLMQMAVESKQQGKGIGKLLVNELLSFCKTKGIKEVTCHSRETAVKFYLQQGFEIYDVPFSEVGIQHSHMRLYL